jgi:HSP20 family molecular chaperone IbpA
MPPSPIELMLDHVRAIFRALTGHDLAEPEVSGSATAPPIQFVAQRFADLEAIARSIPAIADRVPPFYFAPPLDAIGSEREIIVEVGVPGIERHDVEVELRGDLLTIAGTRAGEPGLDGHSYYHAEIPRGPFRRVVRLPQRVVGEPRVFVTHGVISVRLTKSVPTVSAKA